MKTEGVGLHVGGPPIDPVRTRR